MHDSGFLILQFLEHLYLLIIVIEKHILIRILDFIILVEHVVVEIIIVFFLSVDRRLTVLLEEDAKVFMNLLLVIWHLILASTLTALAGLLLESFCVPKRIESMIG